MDKVRLQIISPKKVIFDGECRLVEYNTEEGYVGVLPGHVAMTQVLASGRLTVYDDEKVVLVGAAHSGIARIMPDLITLLVEVCELKEEIDVDRAIKARERALKRLEDSGSGFDMERAKKALKRAEARIQVAGKE